MGKIRVHALAKELGLDSKELLDKLKADGHDVKTASSSIDEDSAAKIRARHGGGGHAPAPPIPALPPVPVVPPASVSMRRKAVKPLRRQALSELSDDERAALEGKRQLRLARLRGEIPPEVEPSPAPAEPEPAVEVVEVAAVAGAAPAPDAAAEPARPAPPAAMVPPPAEEAVVEETVHAAEPVEVPAVQAQAGQAQAGQVQGDQVQAGQAVEEATVGGSFSAEAALEPAPTRPRRMTLPYVIAPPPKVSAGPPTTPVARPPAAAVSTPSAPLRPSPPPREFRGPIRKIELPPPPQRAQPGRAPATGFTRTFSNRPGTGLGKRKRRRGEAAPPTAVLPAPVAKGEGQSLRLTEGVTVKELAEKMEVKAKDLIRILLSRFIMVTVNQALDPTLATSLAVEFGYLPEVVSFEDDLQAQEEEQILESEVFEGEDEPRPPIVTVMGHVDHGKTSLLDRLRKTNVADGEAGGITQSIGAYQIEDAGRKITFVDTPGHEAFTSMRARGAQVTDLVVLVVAATDSVMPQTIEAINHAKAAGVPILVAVNKIDLPNARPERVKQDLMSHGLVPEEFGGDVVCVDVSARTGAGVTNLFEMILLQAEILDLKASPGRRAVGTVVEAGIDRGVGPFANIIVQDGTLRLGASLIVGAEYGRVRALMNDRGERIDSAGPSMPVKVMGLAGVPKAGDRLQVVESEPKAKEISEFRQHKRRESELAKSGVRGSLQDLSKAIAEGEQKELPLVIKADVHGAVEVLTKTVSEVGSSKVKTKIIHSGTGAITDSDVLLASASDPKGVIVGFNVRPERSAADLADREKVIIRQHTVIYELIDELKGLMAGLLDVIREEEYLGRAEVRQTFKVPRLGLVAGCYVQDGKIVRNAEARVVREGVIVWQGKISSLRRFKDDAREVPTGMECGIGCEGYNDVKVGDAIETFFVKETRPTSID